MMLDAPAPVRAVFCAWARISASSGRASRKSQRTTFSSSSATEPDSPQISMRRSQPGQAAVVASIEPIAPSGKRSVAQAVSSASMPRCTRRVFQAKISDGMPTSHCKRSMAWIDWLITAPPPSTASVPFQPL